MVLCIPCGAGILPSTVALDLLETTTVPSRVFSGRLRKSRGHYLGHLANPERFREHVA